MEYKVMHIPKSIYKRPGRLAEKTSITVHNTGVPNTPAINFQRNLCRPDNKAYASFHIVVDETQAIECIPLNEEAFHCAVKEGNAHSIGIEVCEREGAEEQAIKLIAQMLHERKWKVDRVTTHKRWNGKNCPRLILPHWNQFIAEIQKELDKLDIPKVENQFRVYGSKLLGNGLTEDYAKTKSKQLKEQGYVDVYYIKPDGTKVKE